MRRWRFVSPVAALALWQALAGAGLLGKTPSPASVIAGMYELIVTGLPPGYGLFGHLAASLERVLAGFGVALVLAIPIGILMGWSPAFDTVMDPLVELVRPVPPLAWLPLAITWFGIGIFSAAFLIFLGSFFPIVLNTVTGVKSVDPCLVEAARTLGARRKTILARVLVPGSLPSIITGLRIGIGIGWMTVIAAEMTGVKSGYGLGYMIMTARDVANYSYVVAGMVVIGLVGFLMDRIIRTFEKRLLRWR